MCHVIRDPTRYCSRDFGLNAFSVTGQYPDTRFADITKPAPYGGARNDQPVQINTFSSFLYGATHCSPVRGISTDMGSKGDTVVKPINPS